MRKTEVQHKPLRNKRGKVQEAIVRAWLSSEPQIVCEVKCEKRQVERKKKVEKLPKRKSSWKKGESHVSLWWFFCVSAFCDV